MPRIPLSPRRILLATAVATALIAPAAQAATTKSVTESLGPVSATVTYDQASGTTFPPYTNVKLSIEQAGTGIYSAPITSPACGTGCEPEVGTRQSFLHVVDLNGDDQTEVIVDLFTGGAHCCSVDNIYSINSTTGAITQAQHNWGDPGASLKDLSHDGRLEFETGDDRFAYAFDAFAFSGLPIEIERFIGGTFVDVTASYPALVSSDAASWYKQYREARSEHEGLGALAAWAADEDTLGHATLVAKVLARENRLGHLQSDGVPWKGGSAYIHDLQTFLRKTGYV